MREDWWTWLELSTLAFFGSMAKWGDLFKATAGWARVSAIGVQCALAIVIGQLGFALSKLAMHWLPWADESLSIVFVSLLAFIGPLAIADQVNKAADAIRRKLGGGQ